MIWRFGYTLLLWVALPVILARLAWRALKERTYRDALGERFGRYRTADRRLPGQKLIWVHAVSLGEMHASKPLIDRLTARFPGDKILLTQMTASGRDAAKKMFGDRTQIAWLPYDYPFAVLGFLKHFRPDLGILIETEVWFNLIEACNEAGVPLLLANARLSEKSATGYLRIAPLARRAFASFRAVAAQTDADADRLGQFGARSLSVVGNLKFDVVAVPGSEELAQTFRKRFGSRRVFLIASTREGEEALLLDALAARPLPGALIVIVPRHPQRFADVAGLLERRGLSFARRSENREIPSGCDYVLGDSMGEMHAYYRAAEVTFIGGSLLDFGGQNLIEACAAGVPVLIGPSTFNFASAADAAILAGAARRAGDGLAIVEQAALLLEDSLARNRMGEAGREFCSVHRGAADRVAGIAAGILSSGK